MANQKRKNSGNEAVGSVRTFKKVKQSETIWTLEELVSGREIYVDFETKCIKKADGTELYGMENFMFSDLYTNYLNNKKSAQVALKNISSYCKRLENDRPFYIEQRNKHGQPFIDNSFTLFAEGLRESHDVETLHNYLILDSFYGKLKLDKHLIKKIS